MFKSRMLPAAQHSVNVAPLTVVGVHGASVSSLLDFLPLCELAATLLAAPTRNRAAPKLPAGDMQV